MPRRTSIHDWGLIGIDFSFQGIVREPPCIGVVDWIPLLPSFLFFDGCLICICVQLLDLFSFRGGCILALLYTQH